MITRVLLARHGATPWSGNTARYCGATDLPLTELGYRQAAGLARRLESEELAAVVATGLVRSEETALPIARGHDLEVESVPELRELDYGEWEGLTWEEIRERFADAVRERQQDIVKVPVPGGESLRELCDRALPAFLALAQRYQGEQLVIIGHNTTNRVLLCHLLDVPLAHYRRILQSPAGINVIEVEGDRVCVTAINECCHLRGL